MIYEGTAVSDGVAIGKVLRYYPKQIIVEERVIESNKVEENILRYREVVQKAIQELEYLIQNVDLEEEQKKIFQAHIDIVLDEEMNQEIETEIQENLMAPEWAVKIVYDRYIEILSMAKDELIRERVADLKDVSTRLIRSWFGEKDDVLSTLASDVILVAYDLLPSDTAMMKKEHVLAIVTEIGGYTSHMAILARNYGIPAVLGAVDILTKLKDGEKIAVDATSGKVITNLTQDQEKQFQVMRTEFLKKKNDLQQYLSVESLTLDGILVRQAKKN